MKCAKCRREFNPPTPILNAIRATTEANKVPQKALQLVCPTCLGRPQPKELPK